MSVGIRVRAYVLAALFAALVSPQISAQEAHKDAKTLIRQIHFFGDAQLARANQKKFDSLKLSGFAADEAMEKLKERLRYLYQCYGYYKAEIETHAHAVKLNFDEQLLSVDVTIVQNAQYRLARIDFVGQKIVSPRDLRSHFPIQSGEVFNVDRIREGLDNLRKIYDERGYLIFTPVPNTVANDEDQTIDLTIDIDEGPQFHVGTVGFSGLTGNDPHLQERLLKAFRPRPGEVYNPRLIEQFFKENRALLPPGTLLDNVVEFQMNGSARTIDIKLDFN